MTTATVAGIAAGFAGVVSRNRTLLWIAGISFGSLGIVWGATTEGYSIQTRMFVAFVCAGTAAAALVWVIVAIKGPDKPNEAKREDNAAVFDFSDRAKVEANRNTVIGVDRAVRASGDATATVNDNLIIRADAVVPVPPASGALSKLSNQELRNKASDIARQLRGLHAAYAAKQLSAETWNVLRDSALSVASEITARSKPIEVATTPDETSRNIRSGRNAVILGKLVGAQPTISAADYLDFMIAHLPK